MDSFIQVHQPAVMGALSGFDRLRFRGTLRLLANASGLGKLLAFLGILLKDFGAFVEDVGNQLAQATQERAKECGGKVVYISKPSANKEQIALEIAQRRQVSSGLVCILSCVELCNSFYLYRNKETRMLEVRPARRKCLHYYHYYLHETLGLMHVRVQSWLPLNLWVCCNGRERLALQMKRAGIGYTQRDNCFTAIDDIPRAQQLMQEQLGTDWPTLLNKLGLEANPIVERVFAERPLDYYWSVDESEWATDVMFNRPEDLARVYPRLVRHGVENLSSVEVMRYLGKKPRQDGTVPDNFRGEIVTDLRPRPGGLRLKHRLDENWIKMYDKQQSVLRVETVINNPYRFRVNRPAEGDETGKPSVRYLRKGVADLHRRAEVSQRANDRYLQALAAVEHKQPLGELVGRVCQRTKLKGRPVRALNVFAEEDLKLLESIARGEFAINGLSNARLRQAIHGDPPPDPQERKRQSGKVTRQIRMLRAHRLLKKAPKSHRYHLTVRGRQVVTAVLAARSASAATLTQAA